MTSKVVGMRVPPHCFELYVFRREDRLRNAPAPALWRINFKARCLPPAVKIVSTDSARGRSWRISSTSRLYWSFVIVGHWEYCEHLVFYPLRPGEVESLVYRTAGGASLGEHPKAPTLTV